MIAGRVFWFSVSGKIIKMKWNIVFLLLFIFFTFIFIAKTWFQSRWISKYIFWILKTVHLSSVFRIFKFKKSFFKKGQPVFVTILEEKKVKFNGSKLKIASKVYYLFGIINNKNCTDQVSWIKVKRNKKGIKINEYFNSKQSFFKKVNFL